MFVTAEHKRIQLSDIVQVDVLIVGPAPLRVDWPERLLAPESERVWRIQRAGARVLIPFPGAPGWECWIQRYRLDPYDTGNGLPVDFAPITVNGVELSPPGVEVTVSSSLTEITPEAARPVTGIEPLPASPTHTGSSPWWWLLPGLGTVVVLLVVWRWRRRPKAVPPDEWAAAVFDRLERDCVMGLPLVDGVAGVLRGYIDRRFGIAALRLTTSELLVVAEQAVWPIEETDPLRLSAGALRPGEVRRGHTRQRRVPGPARPGARLGEPA